MKTKTSFWGRVLNINPNEWNRLALAWTIRFLYRFGFVLGWIVITTMFVSRFGIYALPYLFVVNAALVILGSAVSTILLQRFRRSTLILWCIFLAGALLFVASFVGKSNDSLLFLLLIWAESLFLVQLNIHLEGLFEDLFTSLESERTFPVIESADMFGGLLGGFVLFMLASSFAISKLIYLWIILLFAIVPLVLRFQSFKVEFGYDSSTSRQRMIAVSLKKRMKAAFNYLRKTPFLKSMALVVLLHWILVNIVEFQYTRAVYDHVKSFVPIEGSGFEHALVHDFGGLNMIFYASAMVVQLFAGSRLVRALGIVGSMLIYPLIMLFSILGLFMNYGFLSSILTRNNFLVASVLHKNSYLSSYYIIREDMRAYVRELFEGVIHPLGALLGTATLIFVQFVFPSMLSMSLTLMMLIVVLALLGLFIKMKRTYTKMACYDLINAQTDEERINAVEILSQRGHANSNAVLIETLMADGVSLNVKVRILQLFRSDAPAELIPSLLQIIRSSNKVLSMAALELMQKFEFDAHCDFASPYATHQVSSTLLTLFKKSSNLKRRITILKILSKLPHFDFVSLIESLLRKRKDTKFVAMVLGLCAELSEPYMKEYARPFLNDKNLAIRAQALVTHWRLNAVVDRLLEKEIRDMLKSDDMAMQKVILDALMYSQSISSFEKSIVDLLSNKDDDLALSAAILLGRFGLKDAIPVLLENLLEGSNENVMLVKLNFSGFHYRIQRILRNTVHRQVTLAIGSLLKLKGKMQKREANRAKARLSGLFSLLERDKELMKVEDLLEGNSGVQHIFT